MIKIFMNIAMDFPLKITHETQLVFDLYSDQFYGNLQARIIEDMDHPSQES